MVTARAESPRPRNSGSEEDEFAAALAAALGPLYRVSVAGPGGKVRAIFGHIDGRAGQITRLRLPGSDRDLVIEVDEAALNGVLRGVHSLLRRDEPGPDVQPGAFTHVDRALDELIAMAEAATGKPIAEMSRSEKQGVVRFLDDRGAFAVRKSVETVAEALGVSRFTVYNYLEAIREE